MLKLTACLPITKLNQVQVVSQPFNADLVQEVTSFYLWLIYLWFFYLAHE